MNALPTSRRLLVGFTLFAMFFGAGNLIFPPWLGGQAGTAALPAFAGFLVTAVGFPILGVMAVAESGGLRTLADRVNPSFSRVFTLLIYLSIGPCLAIPRTASTSFEMVGRPILEGLGLLEASAGGFTLLGLTQCVYSILFFGLAWLVALDPGKLTDRLGRMLCPALLALIAILWAGAALHPLGAPAAPAAGYGAGILSAFFSGFVDGYQTMDTLAALNFGLIIAMNIRALGVTTESGVVRETVFAGAVASVIFFVVYGALVQVGAGAMALGRFENGAQILTGAAGELFGSVGMVLLGLVFFIACFNTCVGLIACCANYFATILPVLGYRGWAALFAIVSMVVSNAGLTLILKLSIPLLIAIYPIAIALIVLALLTLASRAFTRLKLVYPMTILFTGVVSVTMGVEAFGVRVPGLSDAVAALPGSALGLAWVAPAVAGALTGVAMSLCVRTGD